MGCKIDGFIQGIRYESAKERLWFRLKADGADITAATGTPTVQFYTPGGTAIGTANNLTQSGSTGWWYYDLDASTTTTWEKDFGYRAKTSAVVSGITHEDHFFLDVVLWPYNEPLVSTTEVDEEYPAWSASRPSGVSDWTAAILASHLELSKNLRDLKDNQGVAVYPHRILDRGQLRLIMWAYLEERIVTKIIVSNEDERAAARAKKADAYRRLGTFWIDRNDDLIADDSEEAHLSITFEH